MLSTGVFDEAFRCSDCSQCSSIAENELAEFRQQVGRPSVSCVYDRSRLDLTSLRGNGNPAILVSV